MGRKIFITGAKGQLGQSLLKIFRNKFDIVLTDRTGSKLGISPPIESLDITNPINVESMVAKHQPDIIINCAAYTDVDGSEKNKNQAYLVNVVGLQNLINASVKSTLFIQISSDYVFDGSRGPYSELDPTHPVNYYGKTKLEAENILRGARRKYIIIRPNVIYGNDLANKANFFAWIYRSLLNNDAINVVNDQISNPTYVSHLAEAIFQNIILNTKGIYHYGSENYLSRYEFALAIAKYFSLNENLITPITTEELKQKTPSYVAKRPMHSGLKTYKIEDEIGLTAYSTEYSLSLLKNSLVRV